MLDMFWAGEEGAAAVADVLFGDVNPAGRLPYTVYRSDTFLVPMNDRDITKGATYLYYNGEPEYAFGHGLSYTSFAYSKLAITPNKFPNGALLVRAEVANSGKRDGDEVVQVYIHDAAARVKRPNSQLVAFQRVHLKAGERRTLTFTVPAEQLAFWDEGKKMWVIQPGAFDVMVGSSSKDIRLKGQFEALSYAQWPDGARPQ